MKIKTLLFLPVIIWGGAAYATEDGLLNITTSAALCPYGQYHLNGKCIEYTSEAAQDNCNTDYYMTVADQASFMALFPVTMPVIRCKIPSVSGQIWPELPPAASYRSII